jgi:hypothetical protein
MTTTDLTDATMDTLDELGISVIGEAGAMRQLGNAAEGPWGWYTVDAIESAAQVAEEHEGEEHERLNVFAAALHHFQARVIAAEMRVLRVLTESE